MSCSVALNKKKVINPGGGGGGQVQWNISKKVLTSMRVPHYQRFFS